MRRTSLAFACACAVAWPWGLRAQPHAGARVSADVQDSPALVRPVTLGAGARAATAVCETPGPTCDHETHPRRPVLVLVTRAAAADVHRIARAFAHDYAVVVPEITGLGDEAALTELAAVVAHVADDDVGPCCTRGVDVAAVVFLSDAAALGLELLARGQCVVGPSRRVVLVAPTETVRSQIEACERYSAEGAVMPVVVNPYGGACDDAEDVATGALGAGRVLELSLGPLCTFDPTARAACGCEEPLAADAVRRFTEAVLDALDERPASDLASGRARLERARARGGLAFTEHIPSPSAAAGFAFNLTMGGGGFVRDRADGERRGQGAGLALTFRPEITFARAEPSDVGVGLYGEVGTTGAFGPRDVLLGLGLSLVVPAGDRRALVPSVGVHDRFLRGGPGISAGLYFGHRSCCGGLEWPIGVRFDARVGLTEARDHVFTISLQGELFAPVAAVLLLAAPVR